MVQRRGDHHAVWHFWDGPERRFRGWYVNLQTSFVRTRDGYATQDLELDLIVDADRTITVKDDELLEQRVDEGRFTAELVAWVRSYGDELIDTITAGAGWVDPTWSTWTPPDDWHHPQFP